MDQVKAITGMRDPEDFNELETIVGMVAYLVKFIPRLSDLNAPMSELERHTEWR